MTAATLTAATRGMEGAQRALGRASQVDRVNATMLALVSTLADEIATMDPDDQPGAIRRVGALLRGAGCAAEATLAEAVEESQTRATLAA